jgi:hypothetical protein
MARRSIDEMESLITISEIERHHLDQWCDGDGARAALVRCTIEFREMDLGEFRRVCERRRDTPCLRSTFAN